MRRDAPIITDSGGFQVFSLASTSEEDGPELKKKSKRNENGGGSLTSITEHGTVFRSYLDGSTIELTPESSVAAQKIIGGDIIIPLDELPPYVERALLLLLLPVLRPLSCYCCARPASLLL